MSVIGRSYIVVDANGTVVGTDWRINDLSIKGAANAIAWSMGTGPFTVYARDDNAAVFGYVGDAEAPSFIDDNISPDLGRPWAGTGTGSPVQMQEAKSPNRLAKAD